MRHDQQKIFHSGNLLVNELEQFYSSLSSEKSFFQLKLEALALVFDQPLFDTGN